MDTKNLCHTGRILYDLCRFCSNVLAVTNMKTNTFVTAINCMDGRVQEPIITWMKHQYHADYVDMITEPGPIKHLADEKSTTILQSIKKRVEISIQKHGSLVIAVIGHYDCAGNPTDNETQLQQIKTSMNTIKKWGINASIIGLWVDENWSVHQLRD
jgi:carbonic anhydrase